jgi:hypothetical protein
MDVRLPLIDGQPNAIGVPFGQTSRSATLLSRGGRLRIAEAEPGDGQPFNSATGARLILLQR